MKITLERNPAEQIAAGALIVPVLEGKKESRFGAAPYVESGEVAGKAAEFTLLHKPAGAAAARVLLAGAGKAERFDSAELRKLAAASVRFLKEKKVLSVAVLLEGNRTGAEFASAAVEGAILGDFEPDRHKTGNDKKPRWTRLPWWPERRRRARRRGVARPACWRKRRTSRATLANEPANLLTPLKMADAAREMAAGIGARVRGARARGPWRRSAWARCSAWRRAAPSRPCSSSCATGRQRAASAAHLGLVGKGVTFDTGGISIKPAERHGEDEVRHVPAAQP